MRKAPKGGELDELDEQINRIVAKVRAKVEHPFRILKRQFGHVKTRYRGAGEEPGASVHAVRARQSVPRATKAAGMRMGLFKIAIFAAHAGKTVQKLLKTDGQRPTPIRTPAHPRPQNRGSDVPKHYKASS